MASTDAVRVDFDRLWNYSRPQETEERFRELLPGIEPGSDHHIELLTQIARAQGLQRRFDDAHATLDEVARLLGDDTGRPRIRYLLERGRAFHSAIHSLDPGRAGALFEEAWTLARSAGEDGLAVDAAHMRAIVEPDERGQMAWNLRALDVAERSPLRDANAWCGSLYNNIGWSYHAAGRFEDALDMFIRAREWREEKGTPASIRIAKWCVARTLRSLERIEDALDIQRGLLAEFETINEPDGYVSEEIGECLLLLGDAGGARPYFLAAYEMLSKNEWLAESDPARLERLRALGGATEE